MNCLAVIPARGGSKGIPRKNVRLLAGHPLIAHNIRQALRSKLINRLVVSTDDAEIAAVAIQYGAEVVWRPPEISGDSASSEAALLHTLDYLQSTEGYQPDVLVFLQCTSPLTLAEDMDGSVQAVLDAGADTGLAVIPFHYFLWKPQGEDAVGINHTKTIRPLRQERESQFLETGAVYVMRVPGFLLARHRFFGKTALYELPAERRLEIDDPVDFEVAEVLMRQQIRQHQMSALPADIGAIVLDFDGVFTNDKVIVFQDGREAVICDRGDGMGIGLLKKTGLPIHILSTEPNPVVQARAQKLGIPCQHGIQHKGEALGALLRSLEVDPARVIFLGNDVNDLPCMDMVGCPVAVADAHPQVLTRAHIILQNNGGDGALRELSELILEHLNPFQRH